MKPYRVPAVFLVLTTLCSVGCSRNSAVARQKFLERGNRYFQQGKFAEAAIEFRSLAKLEPDSADAHYRLALTETKLGDWSYAIGELERTVALQPANAQAQLDLGNALLVGHDLERAGQIASALIQADPNNAGAHSLFANVNEAHAQPDEAMTEIDKAIALEPTHAAFYVTRGLFEANRGNLDGAEKSLQKATELNPQDSDAMLRLARIYQQQGRFLDAEKYFQRGIAAAPQAFQGRLELARMYLAERQNKLAEQVLLQAQKDLPNDADAYLLLPEFYERLGENDKALSQLDMLHRRHPNDSKTTTEYARALLTVNQLDKAEQLNAEVLAHGGRNPDNLVLKGEILERRGESDAAVSLLRNAVKDDPENALVHYALGSALNQTGDPASAENEWRQAARLEPTMLEAQRALAQVAAIQHDHDLLQDASQQIIDNDPQAPDGYLFRGIAEVEEKDWERAEADFHRAIKVAPDKPEGFASMGDLRLAQERFRDAEQSYEKALELDANSSEAMRGLIAVYTAANQASRGLARVEAQIKKSPKNSAYYRMLGEIQLNQNDYASAEESLREAINLDQNNVDAFLLLGRVELLEGSIEEAIATSYRWMSENPDDATAYVLTGSLEEQRGDWKKGQELYNKALQIQPSSAIAENNLAYSMLENGGNTDVALSLAQSAHALVPAVGSVDDTLAWAYYHKGLYTMSIQLLQDALKLEPDSAPYHYHLGLAYSKLGNTREAKQHLRRALEADPKSAQADSVRKQLHELGG